MACFNSVQKKMPDGRALHTHQPGEGEQNAKAEFNSTRQTAANQAQIVTKLKCKYLLPEKLKILSSHAERKRAVWRKLVPHLFFVVMTPGCLSVTNHLLIFSMLQGKAAFFCNQLRAIRHKPRCLTNLNKIQYIHQVFLGGSKRTLDKREPTISGDSTYKGSAANHCYNSYTSLARGKQAELNFQTQHHQYFSNTSSI